MSRLALEIRQGAAIASQMGLPGLPVSSGSLPGGHALDHGGKWRDSYVIRTRGYSTRMYRGLSVIVIASVLNEERKIRTTLQRVPRSLVDEIVVMDDGCTDRSPEIAHECGAAVIPMGRTVGVGAALRIGTRSTAATMWP